MKKTAWIVVGTALLSLAVWLGLLGGLRWLTAPDKDAGDLTIGGTWAAAELDVARDVEFNRCEIVIEQMEKSIRLWARGTEKDWRSEGSGKLIGRTLHLRWWGTEKKWEGTATLEFSADGQSFDGFFQHRTMADRLPCRGRRAK